MRLEGERESSNVEDRRGGGGLPIGVAGGGIGTVVLVVLGGSSVAALSLAVGSAGWAPQPATTAIDARQQPSRTRGTRESVIVSQASSSEDPGGQAESDPVVMWVPAPGERRRPG